MAIQGLGSSFTYWYNAQTGKLSTKNGEDDLFAKFFNGEELSEEEQAQISQYDRAAKIDLENMINLFSTKGWEGRIFHETDTDLFEIQGVLVDDGCSKYQINGAPRFGRMYGELRYHPSTIVNESGDVVNSGSSNGTSKTNALAKNADTPSGSDGEDTDKVFTGTSTMSTKERREMLSEIINNTYLKEGMPVAPTFPIGLLSFTEEEWEDFLEQIDLAIEAMKMASEEEAKKALEVDRSVTDDIPVQSLEDTAVKSSIDTGLLLAAESSECTYPDDEGAQEITYQIFYTEEGIVCKRFGEKEPVWEMPYEHPDDYEKILQFIGKFDAQDSAGNDQNLRFAAHKNFWEDYLNGVIDEEDFLEFFRKAENGIPSFIIMSDDGWTIDFEHLMYERYFSRRTVQ
ncbi:MAG: hypothetical protein J1E62_03585 [Lachnospiraceae bacterium]|nr:hypothetical protein [Lachnospiraceae bacterium]